MRLDAEKTTQWNLPLGCFTVDCPLKMAWRRSARPCVVHPFLSGAPSKLWYRLHLCRTCYISVVPATSLSYRLHLCGSTGYISVVVPATSLSYRLHLCGSTGYISVVVPATSLSYLLHLCRTGYISVVPATSLWYRLHHCGIGYISVVSATSLSYRLHLCGSPFLGGGGGETFFFFFFFSLSPCFYPTKEVVTFRLRGWCKLGVFLLPAFTRLGHERQDLLSPCDGIHACTD